MLNKLIQLFAEHWRRLNARERTLALAVGALAVAMIALMAYRGAVSRLEAMDRAIDRLHQDIVNYHYQMARRQSVEAQYERVAAQHSSQWTEAEIHDRLRAEIYRLAQKVPPPLGEDGIPVRTTSEEGRLVEIPSLQQGVLLDGGEGYREYRISLRLPQTELMPLVAFLQRLQESPQALRIDSLEISREPLRPVTAARIDITRTVADAAPEDTAGGGGKPGPDSDWDRLGLADWKAEGALIRRQKESAQDSVPYMTVQANTERGVAYRTIPVAAGASYDLYLDLRCAGRVSLGISGDTGESLLESPVSVEPGEALNRYHIQFTAPKNASREIQMRVPALLLEGTDAEAIVHRMVLRKAE